MSRLRIILNPNKDKVAEINEALLNNNGYCPCSLIKNEETKCMCKEFKEQDHVGFCHCGKFLKQVAGGSNE